ncbi:MAG TPA: penicillin-binding transpeptidase domain-containing protein, partial [Polyangiaceae bacterium]|nr:penicillin-binding transpeptidase domain-containing protein [Polyangiaceae bacterium]
MGTSRASHTRMPVSLALIASILFVGCSDRPAQSATAAKPVDALSPPPKPLARPAQTYVDSLRAQVGPGLTLDDSLQDVTERAVRRSGRPAAIVAMEPDTGVVRAVFSVAGERGDPLLSPHVPASTFKVFAALAGLESGKVTLGSEKTCTGVFPFAGKELTCPKAHGRENVVTAIQRSCNGFFYAVG